MTTGRRELASRDIKKFYTSLPFGVKLANGLVTITL